MFFKKFSLTQIRWLPVMFFGAVMLLGLRLHEKQQAFFQDHPWGAFLSNFSFFNVPPLKAADAPPPSPPQAGAETVSETLAEKQKPNASSFPDSAVTSSVPQKPEKAPQEEKALDVLNLTTEEVKILQSLATRRFEIERREKAVNEKEKLIKVMEKRVQEKVTELQSLQDTLKDLVAVREKQQSDELKGLVKIYELMKPEKAAEILSGLGAETLLDLLSGMKDNKLAPILANMNPNIAQQITMALAERRKLTQEIQHMTQQQATE